MGMPGVESSYSPSGRACPTVELITDLSITAVTERGTHAIVTTGSEIRDSGGHAVATVPSTHPCVPSVRADASSKYIQSMTITGYPVEWTHGIGTPA